jgi:hypothetical protein
MTPHPLSTYTEPTPIGDGRSAAIPGIFIHYTGNPSTTPDHFASSATKAKVKGWPVYDLDSGHLAILTAPDRVAAILLETLERENNHATHTRL